MGINTVGFFRIPEVFLSSRGLMNTIYRNRTEDEYSELLFTDIGFQKEI